MYDIHPAADIFPEMSEQEFADLLEDIKINGLLEPIVLYEEKVLDGRHRLRACQMAGIEPRFEKWSNGESPATYVVSKNLHRRHLNTSQRALVAARLADFPPGGDRKKQAADLRSGLTQAEAAKKLNVGERTVSKARAILDGAEQEEIKAVETGRKSVDAIEAKLRPRNSGPKISVPENKSPEQYIREGMAMEEAENLPAETIAKRLGINIKTYRMVRDLVALSDMDFPANDKEIIDAALEYLNKEKKISAVYKSIKPIVRKVWGSRGHRNARRREKGKSERLEIFENTLRMLSEMCLSVNQIDVPLFDEQNLDRVISEIKQAERNIRRFRNKVEGVDK